MPDEVTQNDYSQNFFILAAKPTDTPTPTPTSTSTPATSTTPTPEPLCNCCLECQVSQMSSGDLIIENPTSCATTTDYSGISAITVVLLIIISIFTLIRVISKKE